MCRGLLLALFSCFILSTTTQAQCQPSFPLGGEFINPPACGENNVYSGNLVWTLYTPQELSWTTNFTSGDYYNLTLWQQSKRGGGATVSSTPIYVHNVGDAVLTNVTWVVQTYSFSLDTFNVFYFSVGWSGPRFYSHYFNITRASTTSSSSAVPQSASSTSASASASTTASSTSSTGLSSGAKAGIGVGAATIVALVVIIAFVIWRRRSKTQKTISPPSDPAEAWKKAELSGDNTKVPIEMDDAPVHELDGNARRPAEMHAMQSPVEM